MPRRCAALLPLLVVSVLWAAPLRAEELSLKVENYIFAASEALDDGEPALALSLLRRAKNEAPESCIVEEYLCRCYAALGNVDMAREAYGRFVSCMQVSDEGVLAELDALIVQAEQQPVVPAPASSEPVDSVAPPVVAVVPASASGGGGRVGWVLLGSGAALGVGGSVASWLTWRSGEQYVEQRQHDEYEALAPYNHLAVIGGGVGGALALTGLVVALAPRSHDAAMSAAPWLAPDRAVGLHARVEF
jgi:hypothetical protein